MDGIDNAYDPQTAGYYSVDQASKELQDQEMMSNDQLRQLDRDSKGHLDPLSQINDRTED
jgi:hypothetical protein